MQPLIAVVGSVSDHRQQELMLHNPAEARKAAEEIGRELASSGCRLLVYSTDPDFVEYHVLRGFMLTNVQTPGCIQVRYPRSIVQPTLPDQTDHEELFDWRPDQSDNWEVAYYRSVEDINGMILIGGGQSTFIGGLVTMGQHLPILPLAAFGGAASQIWESLSAERDLVTRDEISIMARPQWQADSAKQYVQILLTQLERRIKQEQHRKLEELRDSKAVKNQALVAMILFILALAAVPIAWGETWIGYRGLLWLLFFAPLLGGVSGATIRMTFDWRQGAVPYTPQSAWITSALGLVAGGASALLFISAQLSALPSNSGDIVAQLQFAQASHLVPFALTIGFVAGLTLDAVFRKLITLDVVRTEAVETRKT